MKFTIVKRIIFTTEELYEGICEDYIDPLNCIEELNAISTKTARKVEFDIFKHNEE